MTEASDGLLASIQFIERAIEAKADGLTEEVFLFLSRVTPLVNVDLLIQDGARRTLLTWRSDQFHGPGWHVPGGIIRYKETTADRIHAVARSELGATVQFDSAPILVQESILPQRRDRGHFISLLYECRLTSDLDERRRYSLEMPLPDQWLWHERCPVILIREQRAYAAYME